MLTNIWVGRKVLEQHYKILGWIFTILSILGLMYGVFNLAVVVPMQKAAIESAMSQPGMQTTPGMPGTPPVPATPGMPGVTPTQPSTPDMPSTEQVVSIAGTVTRIIIGLVCIVCVLGLFTGIGLLSRKKWARTLGIVTSILWLLGPGLIPGIYGLWVFFNKNSATAWESYAA
jgi:hypothetical protein